DYASTKPYYQAWSAEATEASGGKSLGAVRAMHGRVAAGKLTDIAFDDEQKRILVAAKIVDDDEWRKVEEGVYTGFSQGGRYVARWPDPDNGHTRYTAEPREISLVDFPCLPDATFEVVKDGRSERRAFAKAPSPASAAETAAAPGAGEDAAARLDELAALLADARALNEKLQKQIETKDAAEAAAPPQISEPDAALAAASSLAAPLSANAREPAPPPEALAKALGEMAALRDQIAELGPNLTALAARVAALEKQPLPAKAAIRAVAKAHDSEDAAGGSVDDAVKRLAALPSEERAYALMKISLANPIARR
ncbi:MAG TPA: hypothetical protein VKV96_06730, partial [Roseiarcus sp.]|nr:hypothetical protein [Roseiarcus sp.]